MTDYINSVTGVVDASSVTVINASWMDSAYSQLALTPAPGLSNKPTYAGKVATKSLSQALIGNLNTGDQLVRPFTAKFSDFFSPIPTGSNEVRETDMWTYYGKYDLM